ncbi:4-coumarate--CoA ligase-like 9 [Salvia hispanica]|uniref:4-coumarate--CoA ligase-like 9 n=1 Tax=Salvia hispanica TaxID=49212 RepID=UPI0020094981|nr:4-coumarate--CoA ligase-like 9 [Salvia hispanica]
MAETTSINPQNGFCPQTRTYHSLRPAVPLPPPSQPLSIFQYALSLLHSSSSALSTTPFLIEAATARHLTYSAFLRHVSSLSASLKPLLSQNDVAFILSPPSLHIPVLYFSLLSLGAVVSPSNPLSSPSDLSHQISLSRPAIIFATADSTNKLPQIDVPIIILDSPLFLSMLQCESASHSSLVAAAVVDQSAAAAILYSSGTTGRVKGVVLTHRNLIALVAGMYHNKLGEDEVESAPHPVSILTVPLFHVFGFFMLIRAAALGESVVLMERFDFVKMLEAVERYR